MHLDLNMPELENIFYTSKESSTSPFATIFQYYK